MKKRLKRQIALALVLLMLLPTAAQAFFVEHSVMIEPLGIDIERQAGFTDVNANSWYSHYVRAAAEHGIMTGVGNNAFNPSGTFTRAEAVVTLYRMAGSPEVTFAPVFSDVPETAPSWYRDAVIWASEREIVLGYQGLFSPYAPITREAFAAIMNRYAAYQGYDIAEKTGNPSEVLAQFTDFASISQWARPYAAWAFTNELITGVSQTQLAPQRTAIRAEAAAILIRFGVLVEYWDTPERELANTIAMTMQAIPAIMEQASIAGMTVAIVDAETGFTWTQGFGYANAANQTAVTEHTVFPLASISKTFTAVAVMQLVEEGVLDLDRPIVYYLPDFSLAPSPTGGNYRNITARMLLSHTSGILPGMMGYGVLTTESYAGWLNNLLYNLSNYFMVSPENTVFTYANNGFDVLGILVAQLTGNTNFHDDFIAYTQENIFERLGMTRSSFEITSAIAPVLASPHVDATTVDEFLYFNFLPTGGVMSNARDMAVFMHTLLGDGGQLLSQNSLDQIFTVHDFDFSASLGGMRYGLGVMYRIAGNGFESVGHGGTLLHYHSDMVFDLDSGIGVFVSLNSITGLPIAGAVAGDLLQLAVQEKTGELSLQAPRADANATAITMTTAQLEALTGVYLSSGEYYVITLNNGVLYFNLPTVPSIPPLALTPLSDGSFVAEMLGRVWFNPMTVNGEATMALSLGNLGVAPVAFRGNMEDFLASDEFIDEWAGVFEAVNEGIYRSLTTHFVSGVDSFGLAYFQSVNLHNFNPISLLSTGLENWAELTGYQDVVRNADGQVISFVILGKQYVRVS